LVLWLGLRSYRSASVKLRPGWTAAALVAVPLALFAMAADFNRLSGKNIPQSPPPYMGPHLYTVWSVPEPDRVAVIWVTKRFVDREAFFHFIEPFEKVKYGTPFDLPEAGVRRSATQSATQVVMAEHGLKDGKLDALAHMTSLTEITPWMLASDPAAGQLAERLRKTAESACGKSMSNDCLPRLLLDLDDWYRAPLQ
jgi:hypothetical protein